MVICTKCGQVADQGETFCGQCGAFLEWTGAPATAPEAPPPVAPVATPPRRVGADPEPVRPPVVSTLSERNVRVEPGTQTHVTVEVWNRGRTVDQISLEVLGPAAAWLSVEPPQLNLMPGTSAVAAIAVCPPRTPAVPAGEYSVDVAIRSSEHPDGSVVDRITVAVAPFIAFETTLAPSVLRGAAATATLLHAKNAGNAPVELALGGDDPEKAFSFGIDPPILRVDPGAATDALVVVKPRESLQSGPDRTRPFRVAVTSGDGSRRVLDGTFVQAPVPAPPPPPEPVLTGPPLVATLSASAVRVEPGGQAAVTIEVLNRDRTPDRVSIEVRGPAAAWASIDPARLNLAPDASATATLLFRPPRTSSMQPGRYQADVIVVSRGHPDAAVADRVAVDVAPFVALDASLAPSVLRGGREARAKLRIANGGNAPLDLKLGGDDPEQAFELRLSPSKLRLGPGKAGDATVAVRARKENRTRADLSRPFRVLLTAHDGSRHASDGTFIQEAARSRRRWPWAFALLGLLGVIAFFAANLDQAAPQPPPTPTAAPAAPVPAGPDIGGPYYLDPGNSRIIVITPAGENRYTIEEQLPASWPFKGTLEWVGGDRFEGPATFASGTEFRVELERRPDGWLATRFLYISDDQGNPLTRIDEHELVPAS
jgi:hypothetical protein